MLKFIGTLSVLSGCMFISFSGIATEKRKIESYTLLCDFVSYMRRIIESERKTLTDIIKDFSTTSKTAKEHFERISPEELIEKLSRMCPDEKAFIEKSFDTLFVSYDGADASKYIEAVCIEKLQGVKELFERRKKSIALLPIAAGAMLLILII